MAVGTVLVTGGTGYIGSFTSLALLEAGYDVVVVDSLYNSSPAALDRIELLCGRRPAFHQVDITDEAALDAVFDAHPAVDSVIHFAALKVALPFLPPQRATHAHAHPRPSASPARSPSSTTASTSAAP